MMVLKITSIADRGDHAKERIVMKMVSDADVGKFAIFRSVLGVDRQPTNGVADVFWFPDKAIKAEDLVVLYTKSGTTSERLQTTGHTAHFFYWGKPQALWPANGRHVPVLVSTSDWQAFLE